MGTIVTLFIIWYIVLSINGSLRFHFDRRTMYKKQELTDMSGWFIVTYLFFGFFMFIFVKQIRDYRKRYYIKNEIRRYEYWVNLSGVYVESTPLEIPIISPEQYFNYKRYLKLSKIKKRTKNVFI